MASVYTAEFIRNKLATNDKWLVRGLLALYAKQTADEQASESTTHENGCGFNGTDANILSSFAKQVLSWQAQENPRYPSPLSPPKQLELARRKLGKYAGQLARIAEAHNVDTAPVPEPVQEPAPFVTQEHRDALKSNLAQRECARREQEFDDNVPRLRARATRKLSAAQAEEIEAARDQAAVKAIIELAW